MPTARDQLESYVPAWLASRVLGVAAGDDPVGLPFRAAALATDISGFTRLTQELLDRFGNDGVDDLTRTLNA